VDKQLERMLNHQISVEQYEHTDGRGTKKYSDPTVVPCYITGNVRMIRDMQGDEVVSSLSIFLSGTDAQQVGLDDTGAAHRLRITLPDGRQPPILNLHPYYSYRGHLDYVEVSL